MTTRFDLPAAGSPTPVRFPPIVRTSLSNGMSLWTIDQRTLPVATATLVLPAGSARDPDDQPGLASLSADLLDDGAGPFDAIQLADELSRMGARLEIDVGSDATSISVTALVRVLPRALDILGDVVRRPRLAELDFARARDLRLGRLRQLSTSASAMAERTFARAVFGSHPYGHGSLGTTASLHAIEIDDVRTFLSRMLSPVGATLIIGGAIAGADVVRHATGVFEAWTGAPPPSSVPPVGSEARDRPILLVDRPGAPQSELRIGHPGPPRQTGSYHTLVTMNALLGGQFTSRINRRLREEQGVTYGARTAFDFRRHGGVFACETSVQADATARSVGDVLAEFRTVGAPGAIPDEELTLAKASLSRGYVRQFETVAQIVRAAGQLAVYSLSDDTFDGFVPEVERVSTESAGRAAREFVRADDAVVVVVGDASSALAPLEQLGRPVRIEQVVF